VAYGQVYGGIVVSDDEVPPNRPNAKYKLSKPDNGQSIYGGDKPVFHYSRERRLEKAPQIVKDMYSQDQKPKGRFAIFGSLIADRPRKALFLSIVILIMIVFILSVLNRLDNYYAMDGNRLDINGVRFEGNTIIVIRKSINKKSRSPYTGAVDIAVTPAQQPAEIIPLEEGEISVFYQRIFFSLENEEEYRFVVPFDTQYLVMVIQTERSTMNIKLRTE
jgi:hypothetical protein